jgi:hypothetical protein
MIVAAVAGWQLHRDWHSQTAIGATASLSSNQADSLTGASILYLRLPVDSGRLTGSHWQTTCTQAQSWTRSQTESLPLPVTGSLTPQLVVSVQGLRVGPHT